MVFVPEDGDELDIVGELEMQGIAYRYGRRYAELLEDAKPEEKVYYTSGMKRNLDSMPAFQLGFSMAFKNNQTQEFDIREDIVRFYDQCPALKEGIMNNRTAMAEFWEMLSSPEMMALTNIINEKLQLSPGTTLTLGK